MTFFALQALVIPIHELTHSIVACLLGHRQNPFDIVWGNFLTMAGWDERVDYHSLFLNGKGADAAVIAASPLIGHIVVTALCCYLQTRDWILKMKWLFHALFWLTVVNLMELFAYMPMRAFASHGDLGNINHGLGLSPWVIFIPGFIGILAALAFFFGNVYPRLCLVFAADNRWIQREILALAAFLIFVHGSGLRVVLYVYPDPQWILGLLGFAGFVVVLYLFRGAANRAAN